MTEHTEKKDTHKRLGMLAENVVHVPLRLVTRELIDDVVVTLRAGEKALIDEQAECRFLRSQLSAVEANAGFMLASYLAFIRGKDISETVEKARAALVERTLRAEAGLQSQAEKLEGLRERWERDYGAIHHRFTATGMAHLKCARELSALLSEAPSGLQTEKEQQHAGGRTE